MGYSRGFDFRDWFRGLLDTFSILLDNFPDLLDTFSILLDNFPDLLDTFSVLSDTFRFSGLVRGLLDNFPIYWTLSWFYWTLSRFYWTLSPIYWTLSPIYWTLSPIYWTLFPIYWTLFPVYWTLLRLQEFEALEKSKITRLKDDDYLIVDVWWKFPSPI